MTTESRGVWTGLVVAAALGWVPPVLHVLEDFTSTLSGWGFVTRGLHVLRLVTNPGSLVSSVVPFFMLEMSESRRYVAQVVTECVVNMVGFVGTWLVLMVNTRFSVVLRWALVWFWGLWVLSSLFVGLVDVMFGWRPLKP